MNTQHGLKRMQEKDSLGMAEKNKSHVGVCPLEHIGCLKHCYFKCRSIRELQLAILGFSTG